MIKKTIKYLSLLILLLLLAVLLLYLYATQTQHGSRLTLDLVVKYTGINLSYADVQGTLSDGLELSGLKYQDETLALVARKINYKNDWSLFERQLNLTAIQIDDVVVSLSDHQTSSNNEPFKELKWPLGLNIDNLIINQLTVNHPKWSQQIEQLTLAASAHDHILEIIKLQVVSNEIKLQTAGSIKTQAGLEYNFNPTIEFDNNHRQFSLVGTLEGNLNSLYLKQIINVKDDLIDGEFSAKGSVSLAAIPNFDLTIKSDQAKLNVADQNINLSQITTTLVGDLSAYQLNLNAQLQNEQYPAVEIMVLGEGDLNQFTTQSTQVITQDGLLNLAGTVNWQNVLDIQSQIVLQDFNPGQIISTWPGNINGTVNIAISTPEDKLIINSKNNQLQGILKDNKFKLTGDLAYAENTIKANHLQLTMGQNHLIANGLLTENEVDMLLDVNLPELALFNSDWRGQLTGTINLSGDHQNPDFTSEFLGNNLFVEGIDVSNFKLKANGKWEQELNTDLVANQLQMNDRKIDYLAIKQTGWIEQHELNLTAKHDDIEQNLQLNGSYDPTTTFWHGKLQQHNIVTDLGANIRLLNPVAIEKKDHWVIAPACWQGVEQGSLCIELTDTSQQYKGNIKLEALSLQPFQLWLPANLNILGKAEGQIGFVIDQNDINLKSNLKLIDGQLLIKQDNQVSYQTTIKKLNIFTQSQQSDNEIHLEFMTQAGDQLNVTANMTQNSNTIWAIDGHIKGEIVSTDVINELTAEISEIEGKLAFEGSINGPIVAPLVQLNFEQPKGFVRFSRFGSLVEGLKISIKTENKSTPEYNIILSGSNLASINQGTFIAQGKLSETQQSWHLDGNIKGENFMLFNMPELKLHVSPDLQFVATDAGMNITGELILDQGKVLIEQLPPETVTNSNDLVINQPEDSDAQSLYSLTFDIKTAIKDKLELKVIGLDAFLSGSLQLTQKNNKAMSTVGTLNLEEGKYEIYGQKLSIDQGELFFNGNVNDPRLNVRASRRSLDDTVTAGVQLGGTVKNLQSNLFSDPSLSDIEILSYIMTGEGINNAGSISGEQLKQTAILMGLNQSAPVFKEIQNTFGIDVLTIKEAASKSDTVIEAGKRINDKLYISYNHGIFNRLGFWVLKYKLNEFLNLQTTQGEDQSIELVYTRKARIKNKDKTDINQEDKGQ